MISQARLLGYRSFLSAAESVMVLRFGTSLSIAMAIPALGLAAAPPALAQASGCAGVIEPFRRAVESDVATGNLHRSVYSRIKPEIDRANAACASGRDAEAVRMITATKGRYGYR